MKVFRVTMKANKYNSILVGAEKLEDVIADFSSKYGVKAILKIEPTQLPLGGVRTLVYPKQNNLTQTELF